MPQDTSDDEGWRRSPGGTWEQRDLQVKGREELVRAWTLRLSVAAP